jgi:hypothetical protein
MLGSLAASIEEGNECWDFLKRRETSEKPLRFMLFVLNITVGIKEWFECVTAAYS